MFIYMTSLKVAMVTWQPKLFISEAITVMLT